MQSSWFCHGVYEMMLYTFYVLNFICNQNEQLEWHVWLLSTFPIFRWILHQCRCVKDTFTVTGPAKWCNILLDLLRESESHRSSVGLQGWLPCNFSSHMYTVLGTTSPECSCSPHSRPTFWPTFPCCPSWGWRKSELALPKVQVWFSLSHKLVAWLTFSIDYLCNQFIEFLFLSIYLASYMYIYMYIYMLPWTVMLYEAMMPVCIISSQLWQISFS